MVGEPDSNATIAMAGGEKAYSAIAGPDWRNELCARTALGAGVQPADQIGRTCELPAAGSGRDL